MLLSAVRIYSWLHTESGFKLHQLRKVYFYGCGVDPNVDEISFNLLKISGLQKFNYVTFC